MDNLFFRYFKEFLLELVNNNNIKSLRIRNICFMSSISHRLQSNPTFCLSKECFLFVYPYEVATKNLIHLQVVRLCFGNMFTMIVLTWFHVQKAIDVRFITCKSSHKTYVIIANIWINYVCAEPLPISSWQNPYIKRQSQIRDQSSHFLEDDGLKGIINCKL